MAVSKHDLLRKKIFMRVLNGFKVGEFKAEMVRFVTLTTSSTTAEALSTDEVFELLQINKRRLIENIRRHKKSKTRFTPGFGFIDNWDGFNPDYIDVYTDEGNGVIHILYRGGRIPFNWLMCHWNELHGSHIVHIRSTYGDAKGSARYVSSQYLSSQRCERVKYHCSYNWIYTGFMKDWTKLKSRLRVWCSRNDRWSEYRENLFDSWDGWLKRKVT